MGENAHILLQSYIDRSPPGKEAQIIRKLEARISSEGEEFVQEDKTVLAAVLGLLSLSSLLTMDLYHFITKAPSFKKMRLARKIIEDLERKKGEREYPLISIDGPVTAKLMAWNRSTNIRLLQLAEKEIHTNHHSRQAALRGLRTIASNTPLDLKIGSLDRKEITGSEIGNLSEVVGQSLEPYIEGTFADLMLKNKKEAGAFFLEFCHHIGYVLTNVRKMFGGSLGNLIRLMDKLKGDEVVVAFLKSDKEADLLLEAHNLVQKFLHRTSPRNRKVVLVVPTEALENYLIAQLKTTGSDRLQVVYRKPDMATLSTFFQNGRDIINPNSLQNATFRLLLHQNVDLPQDFMKGISSNRYHLYLLITSTLNPLIVEFKQNQLDADFLKDLHQRVNSQA